MTHPTKATKERCTDPLVERVAEAMRIALRGNLTNWERDLARAAIETVLEWYSKAENINEDMIREVIINRGVSAHQVVAAAMAAELKRRQG